MFPVDTASQTISYKCFNSQILNLIMQSNNLTLSKISTWLIYWNEYRSDLAEVSVDQLLAFLNNNAAMEKKMVMNLKENC